MDDQQVAIPRLLRVLTETAPDDGSVLSLYLDTSPSRGDDAALIAFRDLARTMRRRLAAEQREAFNATAGRVERLVAELSARQYPGLAVFAAAPAGSIEWAPLPERPREELVWDARPALAQLQEALDDQERVAVALVDKERGRLYSIFLGRLEESQEVEDAVPPKHRSGGWHLLSQTRFARHHEDRVAKHARRVAAALMALLRRRPFDRLLIGGPPEAVAALRHELPRPLRARLAGQLRLELFAAEADVLAAGRVAADAAERARELTEVGELADATASSHAALGPVATLAAASDGRLHRLLIADGFDLRGGECPACGRLTLGLDACAACGVATTPVADLRERLVQRALAQGARVEAVSDEAARVLAAYGGVGAWTRYAAPPAAPGASAS